MFWIKLKNDQGETGKMHFHWKYVDSSTPASCFEKLAQPSSRILLCLKCHNDPSTEAILQSIKSPVTIGSKVGVELVRCIEWEQTATILFEGTTQNVGEGRAVASACLAGFWSCLFFGRPTTGTPGLSLNPGGGDVMCAITCLISQSR